MKEGPPRRVRSWAAVCEPLACAALLAALARWPAAVGLLPGLAVLEGAPALALLTLALLVGLLKALGSDFLACEDRAAALPGWALFAVAFAVFSTAGLRYAGRLQASGDEPHYLLMAQSLWQEADLDLRDNYSRQDFLDYAPGPLAPHYGAPRPDGRPFPAHSAGLPALLAPVYAVGGRAACVVALALMAAWMALEARRLTLLVSGSERAALLAWLAAVGPPVFYYSFHVYTEVAAALALAFSLRRLLESNGPAAAAAASLAACALPWLHLKMALASVALGALAVHRLRGRELAAFAGVAAAAGAAFAAYYAAIFGRPSPFALYGGVPRDLLTASPRTAAVGLLLDRSFGLLPHAPVFLLSLAGAAALGREGGRGGRALLLAGGAVLAPALGWRMWWGGQCPPARFLVPLVPILACAAGLFAVQGRGLARWRHALLGLGAALAVLMVARPEDRLLLNRGDRPTRVWEALSGARPIGPYLPSLVSSDPAEARVATVWIAGLALLLGLHWAARRRDRVDRLFQGLALPSLILLLVSAGVDLWARSG